MAAALITAFRGAAVQRQVTLVGSVLRDHVFLAVKAVLRWASLASNILLVWQMLRIVPAGLQLPSLMP